MSERFPERIAELHGRIAPPVLVVPALVLVATWQMEAYFYGAAVVLLAPVQFAWGMVGFSFAALGSRVARSAAALLWNAGSVICAVLAFLALRSINWA